MLCCVVLCLSPSRLFVCLIISLFCLYVCMFVWFGFAFWISRLDAKSFCQGLEEPRSGLRNEKHFILLSDTKKKSLPFSNPITSKILHSSPSIQTRSSDEPMTVFVCCLTCGKRWREWEVRVLEYISLIHSFIQIATVLAMSCSSSSSIRSREAKSTAGDKNYPKSVR